MHFELIDSAFHEPIYVTCQIRFLHTDLLSLLQHSRQVLLAVRQFLSKALEQLSQDIQFLQSIPSTSLDLCLYLDKEELGLDFGNELDMNFLQLLEYGRS